MSTPSPWMPFAIQIKSARSVDLNNNGFKLLTWHTMECPYHWGNQSGNYSGVTEKALRFLLAQGTEAFVFHPKTGEWGQCQPMTTGARALLGGKYTTNTFGSVHQQVEVIGYASRPWTLDLTKEGREGLKRGLDFFRSWGIPDQWAFNSPPPAYPGPGVVRAYPSRSGHAYHAGWIGNDHGDPGAISAPWDAVKGVTSTTPVQPPSTPIVSASPSSTLRVGSVNDYVTGLQSDLNKVFPSYSKLVVDGVFGKATESVVREFQKREKLSVDGIVGPVTWGALAKHGIGRRKVSVPVINTPVTSSSSGRNNLQAGSTGDNVRKLQSGLNRVFPAYSKLVVDGIFGLATEGIVREFQRRSKLSVDGIVGPKTKAELAKYAIIIG